jgi:hypothetical protein
MKKIIDERRRELMRYTERERRNMMTHRRDENDG